MGAYRNLENYPNVIEVVAPRDHDRSNYLNGRGNWLFEESRGFFDAREHEDGERTIYMFSDEIDAVEFKLRFG